MLARALSGTLFGLEGMRVEVEADIADGLPGFHIVGLGDRALQEARERVKIAINNSGFQFPGRRVTVNLAPAQLPKEGTGFDLAIAAAVVNAAEDRSLSREAAWLGELALDGSLRPIRGTLPIAAHLDRLGVRRFYVPVGNVPEARIATSAHSGMSRPSRSRCRARLRHRPNRRPQRRCRLISRRFVDRRTRSGRSKSRRPVRIIFYWSVRPGRGRRCWRGHCPESCRR